MDSALDKEYSAPVRISELYPFLQNLSSQNVRSLNFCVYHKKDQYSEEQEHTEDTS